MPESVDSTEPYICFFFSYTDLSMVKFNSLIRHSKRISELPASLFLCTGAFISKGLLQHKHSRSARVDLITNTATT